eukprot:CAMPEP_0179320542 /NCGR_PEP_ID=MMETSP0797-20121207/58107_1 /TAXON_ID=47934 /ORGANISM="Dinophysis acuminata, Strain DAEP01" /LENGTH=97 /DNA_ID=CAMNT_0021032053 /DNA_START=41 /DNA_END=333 /DNA_ORIENTATION=+
MATRRGMPREGTPPAGDAGSQPGPWPPASCAVAVQPMAPPAVSDPQVLHGSSGPLGVQLGHLPPVPLAGDLEVRSQVVVRAQVGAGADPDHELPHRD